MTKNKLFLEAIGNKNLQSVLKQIYLEPESEKLQIRLRSARAFTIAGNFEMTTDEVLEQIKNASGEDLDIVLGNYKGEIPTVGHFG